MNDCSEDSKQDHDEVGKSSPRPRSASNKTLAWTSSTYFAEGMPWSLLHQVASEYFTAIGVAPAGVGRTSLLHGPMLFKMFWSPLVELFGTLRSWMVATQAMMGVTVGLLAYFAHLLAKSSLGKSGEPDTTAIWILLFSIGVLSAIHDIACDGFYMEALGEEEQAKFSGVRIAAFRAAMLVGSAGLVFLGGSVHWSLSFGVGALLLIGLALFHRVFLPHPSTHLKQDEAQRLATESHGGAKTQRWRSFVVPYLSFLKQDSILAVVAFLVFYKMADALMFSMSVILLGRELGIGTELRAMIRFFSILASILGAIGGGRLIAKYGLKKTLFPITVLMVGTEPLYALLASWSDELSIFKDGIPATWQSFNWVTDSLTLVTVTLVVVIEQVLGGLATAAQVVFIMRRCNIEHKTTHYAFATVLYSLAQIGIGATSGVVYQSVGSVSYFWLVSALGLPAVALSLVVPKD